MVNLSMKKSLLLFVAALLCILPLWSKSVHADRNEEYGELIVSILVDGDWIKQGSLTYGRFVTEKSLQLKDTQADKSTVVRIMQQGGGKSHLDSVLLGTQTPIKVNEDTAASVRKLAAADQDLINIEASGVIMQFASGNADSILKIDGRIEPEVISKIPFHYPTSNLYKEFDLNSEYYTYTLNSSRGNQVMDGQLNEISSQVPFFQQYTVPDSGHPEGITYGWVWNDDDNLYVFIDFTSDNTFDGDADYTKVYVKTNSGAKEFEASVSDTAWGQPFFTYTDKVSYEHKVYEYQIPLKNLDIAADQTELQLGFAAYGTASSGSATDNDQIHVGIDGRDISVEWQEYRYSQDPNRETFTFDIYILPSTLGRTPDRTIDNPISTIPHGPDPVDMTWNWTGSSTDTLDSTGMPLAGGDYKVFVYMNFSPVAGVWGRDSHSITLQTDVDVSKFSEVDNYTGTQDQLQGAPNAVGANLPVTAYLWNDSDSNNIVDPLTELGAAISLGTSAADGSVAAADIGDLNAGTYRFVITSTDKGNESIKDAAHAISVNLYNNAFPVQVTVDSISSSNPTPGVAKIGDTMTVTFTTDRELSELTEVYIGYSGLPIPPTSVGDNVYSGSYTFTASDNEGEVTIFIGAAAMDSTNNHIWASTDSNGNSVTFDKTSPTGTLSINGGAATTDSAAVTLTVTGEDPDGIGSTNNLTRAEKQPIQIASTNHLILWGLGASMKLAVALPSGVPGTGNVEMAFSNDEVNWSKLEPVAGMKTWTLSAGNGTKTVYMKLKDAAGNETVITASIELKSPVSPPYGGNDSNVESEPIKKEEKPKEEKPEVEKQHKAYIIGYPDGTFGPEDSITRAEVATLLFRTFEKAASKADITYTDVASTHWAREAIEQVTRMGMIVGYEDGSFKGEQMITRAEIAVVLSRLSSNSLSSGESFSDVQGHWAQTAIEQLKMTGIISGYPDGTFRPEQTLKRAEVVAMINKLLDRGPLTTMAARWSDVPNDHWAFGEIQAASIDHASGQEVNRK